jgi:hypothetical protein
MIVGRVAAIGIIAALTLGCGNAQREKAVADSIAAVAATDAALIAAAAADSARRDSILRTTTAERARSAGAKTTKAASTIIGRDSVRQGPIIAVPIKPDTVKRRPPR